MARLMFDIGNTKKKAFVFDDEMKIIHQEYKTFDELADDEGLAMDDMSTISDRYTKK